MSVKTNINKTLQDGNGFQTTFEFSFNILKDTELEVYKVNKETGETGEPLELNRDYIVTINKIGEGGSVTYTVPPTEFEQAGILRVVEITQPMDIQVDTEYAEKTMNNAFDKACMIDQQLQDQLDRSFKLPFSFTSRTFDPELKNIVAGKAIKINDTGDGLDVTEENADTIIETTKAYRDEAENFKDDAYTYMQHSEMARDEILNNTGFIAVANDLLGNNTIGTVAGDIAKVNTVSTNINAVNNVSNNMSAVTNVNTNMAKVSNVNANITPITNVSNNMNKVSNLDTNMGAITNVDTNMSAVNKVSDNVDEIKEVKDMYYKSVDGNISGNPINGGSATSVFNSADVLDGNDIPLLNILIEGVRTNATGVKENEQDISALFTRIVNSDTFAKNLARTVEKLANDLITLNNKIDGGYAV